jgi:hypothetical protein
LQFNTTYALIDISNNKDTKRKAKMETIKQAEATEESEAIDTWNRERSVGELRSFVTRRMAAIEDL